jgi:hypothetical protein
MLCKTTYKFIIFEEEYYEYSLRKKGILQL